MGGPVQIKNFKLRKMHICFVMAALPHYFKLLLNKLVTDYGLTITLITPTQRGQSVGSGVKEDKQGGLFTLVQIDEEKAWYGKAYFPALVPTLAQLKPDVVVMSSWPYFLQFALNPLFYFRFKSLKIKLICRDIPFNVATWGKVHDYYYTNQNVTEDFRTSDKSLKGFIAFLGLSWLRKVYLPVADAHINYLDEAYDIIGSYGVPREMIFVTANSPDTDELLAAYETVKNEPLALPENPHRIIHVGRLVKWKRVDLIMEAVQKLQTKFPQIELIVVGFGPAEDEWKTLAQTSGLAERVRFVGGVYNPVDLGKYLHASSIYVLGGMGGLSINDAMCFAKPIVCSVADGTEKRLVREGENGHYFENGNADDLARAIDWLLSDPQKVKTFGARSLEIIQKEINIHTVLDGYMAAFRYVHS
jgi:glycosyltransferase involved in cell wall biosynthesis